LFILRINEYNSGELNYNIIEIFKKRKVKKIILFFANIIIFLFKCNTL